MRDKLPKGKKDATVEGYFESITTPVLMVLAGGDEIVSVTAQEKICRRLSNCDLVVIPDALHELLIENNTVLEIFWENFDKFVL